MKDQTKITRPSGWSGARGETYWTKSSKYGQRYMCQTCGKDALGLGDTRHNHWPQCSKTQTPPLPREAPAVETQPMERTLDLLFGEMPGPETKFLEAEIDGHSVSVGQWVEREDGLAVLRFTVADLRDILSRLGIEILAERER